MANNVPNDKAAKEAPPPGLPRGEPWVSHRYGLADRLSSLPRGPALAGLAVATTAGAALLLLARPHTGRLPELLTGFRPARRVARAKGFWVGVLAATGRAVTSTVARRLAENFLENRRRQRAEGKCVLR